MKKQKFQALTLALLGCAMNGWAQQAVNTENGKAVQRVTFDRELVTIIYVDGTEETVDASRIVWDNTTGIESVRAENTNAGDKADGIYDMQGRRVTEENLLPGIYVMRRDGNSVKIIKK